MLYFLSFSVPVVFNSFVDLIVDAKHWIAYASLELDISAYFGVDIQFPVFLWNYLTLLLTISVLLKQPTECNTYADIEAAYNCLREQYGVKDEQLILYGQSVGSGPTVDLASQLTNLRGVVLHSPILSGMRVLYPVKRTYWFDIYKVMFVRAIKFYCIFLLYSAYENLYYFFSEHWQNRYGELSCSDNSCKYCFPCLHLSPCLGCSGHNFMHQVGW